LFQFAWRKGWVKENVCRKVEHYRVERHEPKILTPAQVEKIFRYCHKWRPDFLATLTLMVFAGVRPHEALRLKWGTVDWDAGTVMITAEASKIHRRRIVHLMPNALAWLKKAWTMKSDLPVPKQNYRRRLYNFRKLLGLVGWPQDVARHTAATYWLANVQDAGKVAMELGNSAKILLTHYNGLATRAAAKKFWGILPFAAEVTASPAARNVGGRGIECLESPTAKAA